MKLRLENTSYRDFDAWLRLRAKKYGFLISYDKAGLRENKKDLNFIPHEIYPLRIFLSKVSRHGIAFDYDCIWEIEKAGLDLSITLALSSDNGKENLKPILSEVVEYWPKNRSKIESALKRLDSQIKQSNDKKNKGGRDSYPGYNAAFDYWGEKGFLDDMKKSAFDYWYRNFEDEWQGKEKTEAYKAFSNAMWRRKIKLETRNPS